MSDEISILAVGDVGPVQEHQPERLFELCAPVVRSADIAFCHMEISCSHKGAASVSRGGTRRGHPNALKALKYAGFDVVSFAGNHVLDYGMDAFLDTLDSLQRQGHHVIGAGIDLVSARQPAIIDVGGTKVAFLAYCSIVMARLDGYIADAGKPGIVPLRVWTHYEPIVQMFDYTPGMPARTITVAYPDDLDAMRDDIRNVRDKADVVVVSQHSGVPFMHAHVAMYQREIAKAGIDAGADVILQHHAHVLRGIDFYRGRPIFHGLGDFGWEAGMSTKGTAFERPGREAREMAEFQAGLAGQVGRPGAMFGPQERHLTLAAKFSIDRGLINRVSYLPAYLNEKMQARVLSRSDAEAQQVFDFVRDITEEEHLNASFEWDGDEVVVTA